MLRTTSRRHRRTPPTAVRAAALALLALTGCGDDGTSPPASQPSASADATVTSEPAATDRPADAEVTAAVQDTWTRYGKALQARDGDAAAALVSSSTWPMYERQRKLALTATEKELRAAPVVDQLGALILRAKVEPATLRSATPRELIAVGVDKGLVAASSVAENTLGTVTTDGDTAYAQQVYLGRVTPNRIVFRLEDGAWRLDLAELTVAGEAALRATAESQGRSVAELVDLSMRQVLGPERARTIWEPIDPA